MTGCITSCILIVYRYPLPSAGVVVGFEEPWYTVYEGAASVEVCVGVVQGVLTSDLPLTFTIRTQQATTDYAVGKCACPGTHNNDASQNMELLELSCLFFYSTR